MSRAGTSGGFRPRKGRALAQERPFEPPAPPLEGDGFWLVGIDCATANAAVGLALGQTTTDGIQVHQVRCPGERAAAAIVADWLCQIRGPCIIALDAPLGWPLAMGRYLSEHRAGRVLPVRPNELFRRETDRFIYRKLQKTPLDVGADRIARTGHAALQLLGELRTLLDAPIPLAWSPGALSGVAAIEVYPAATLVAHALPSKGYKKRDNVEQRRTLLERLRPFVTVCGDATVCDTSPDALDAIICVLAAGDFVMGAAVPPEDRALAEREGWIWVAAKGA